MSQAASSRRSFASLSDRVLDSLGAAPAMLDVEKKTGSRPAKSFSSRILCMRTLPTMPRHPIKPTRGVATLSRTVWLIMPLLKGFSRRVLAHRLLESEVPMDGGKRCVDILLSYHERDITSRIRLS